LLEAAAVVDERYRQLVHGQLGAGAPAPHSMHQDRLDEIRREHGQRRQLGLAHALAPDLAQEQQQKNTVSPSGLTSEMPPP
jgi:hypothetical protein